MNIFNHVCVVNTTLPDLPSYGYYTAAERAQFVADLLSLPQPDMSQAQAGMMARWLVRIEMKRGDAGFAAAVARRVVGE